MKNNRKLFGLIIFVLAFFVPSLAISLSGYMEKYDEQVPLLLSFSSRGLFNDNPHPYHLIKKRPNLGGDAFNLTQEPFNYQLPYVYADDGHVCLVANVVATAGEPDAISSIESAVTNQFGVALPANRLNGLRSSIESSWVECYERPSAEATAWTIQFQTADEPLVQFQINLNK